MHTVSLGSNARVHTGRMHSSGTSPCFCIFISCMTSERYLSFPILRYTTATSYQCSDKPASSSFIFSPLRIKSKLTFSSANPQRVTVWRAIHSRARRVNAKYETSLLSTSNEYWSGDLHVMQTSLKLPPTTQSHLPFDWQPSSLLLLLFAVWSLSLVQHAATAAGRWMGNAVVCGGTVRFYDSWHPAVTQRHTGNSLCNIQNLNGGKVFLFVFKFQRFHQLRNKTVSVYLSSRQISLCICEK